VVTYSEQGKAGGPHYKPDDKVFNKLHHSLLQDFVPQDDISSSNDSEEEEEEKEKPQEKVKASKKKSKLVKKQAMVVKKKVKVGKKKTKVTKMSKIYKYILGIIANLTLVIA